MNLDEQIEMVAERANAYTEWSQATRSPDNVTRMRHHAGEWLAVENSLRELRSRRAGEWQPDQPG